jgi:spore germination protein
VKNQRKSMILFLISICCVSLLGCTRMRTIDKVSMVHVMGLDKDGELLVGTALYPNYMKSKDSDNIQLLTEKVAAGNLFYQEFNKHTDTPVKFAKIRVIVFGKKYAEAGIGDIVKRFMINPELGTRLQIVVSEQSAEDTLREFSKGDSLNLLDIIQHNITRQYLPEMNLHFFLNHFYGQGMDAFVPVVLFDHKNKIMVDGIGIFKDDKLKLELNDEQTFIFSLLKNSRVEGTLKMDVEHMGKKGIVTIRGYKNSQKWEFKNNNMNQPELNLTLKLKWTASQYPDWINISSEKDKQLLIKLIKIEVKKMVEELLMTLKKNEVDPLGIGNIVRSQIREWDEKEFYETYPSLPINVEVQLEIMNAGLDV